MSENLFGGNLLKIIEAFAARCSTDLGIQALACLANEDWDALVNLTACPRKNSDPLAYQADADLVGLFRKLEDLPTSYDKDDVALASWWQAERDCYRTNERFAALTFDQTVAGERILGILSEVRKEVADILGRPPELFEGGFGPGSTFTDPSVMSTVLDKVSSCPSYTGAAWPWLIPWTGTAWATSVAHTGKELEPVRGNRFATVPKDSRKNRSIGIEPSINVFFQLGVGKHIRQRLKKRAGIDLDQGQALNQEMARKASISGAHATLDLASASDTMSTELVRALVPPSWWDILSSLRSPYTLVRGNWVKLEKFSSMGNGFTFELETLLFYALSKVACKHAGVPVVTYIDLAVYGDDIIVPTAAASNVIAILSYCGFTLNKEKSFVEGGFRESCGADAFNGVDVRPFNLKELPTEPQHWIGVANGIYRLAHRNGGDFTGEPMLYRAWTSALSALPSPIRRLRGPNVLGDLLVHDRPENWNLRVRNSKRYFRVYRPVAKPRVLLDGFAPISLLAGALYGISPTNSVGRPLRGDRANGCRAIVARDQVDGYRLGWVVHS